MLCVDTVQLCDKRKVLLWNMSLQLFHNIKKLKMKLLAHQHYLTANLLGRRLVGKSIQDLVCCGRTKLVAKMKFKYA